SAWLLGAGGVGRPAVRGRGGVRRAVVPAHTMDKRGGGGYTSAGRLPSTPPGSAPLLAERVARCGHRGAPAAGHDRSQNNAQTCLAKSAATYRRMALRASVDRAPVALCCRGNGQQQYGPHRGEG